MLSLSDRYIAAPNNTQRVQILLIGDAIGSQLIATPQTTGFMLLSVAALITSVVMLRNQLFSNGIDLLGILASILIFALQISVVMAPKIADPLMGLEYFVGLSGWCWLVPGYCSWVKPNPR